MGSGGKTHVCVVGAGVFGAWTAHHLQQLGHRVTLIDAYGPAHSRASSGGESRLIRGVYGADEIYTRMAHASLPQWQALNARGGLPIFVPSGVLFFAERRDAYFDAAVEVHRRLSLDVEQLDRPALQKRFPAIDFAEVEVGLFEPAFGALMARRAVQTLVAELVKGGGELLNELVLAPTASRDITFASGAQIAADFFVFAAGPWLPKLFPDVVGARIRPTRQEVFYFAAPTGDSRLLPSAMPCWCDFNGGDMFYGTPDLEGRGVKLAYDRHGKEIDPDTQDRRPTDAALDQVVAFRDRRFPLLRGAPLIGAEVCQYENSSNGDFLIDRHPEWDNILLIGGGSGHGFKHGPEVGRYAAARLFDAVEPEPRFSLAVKSETHSRLVH